VAKGYPDYYRGSLLFGLRDDIPTGINMDDAGNLVALLKAMSGTTPVTLACDADGNLKVSVEVNTAIGAVEPKDTSTVFKVTPDGGAAVMKVAEQSPLTTIKVAPTDANPTFKVTPDGGAAVMKVAEQSPLTSMKIEPKEAATTFKTEEQNPLSDIEVSQVAPADLAEIVTSGTLTSYDYTTLLNFTTSCKLHFAYVEFYDYLPTAVLSVQFSGSYPNTTLITHDSLRDISFQDLFSYLFKYTTFDTVNNVFVITFKTPITITATTAFKAYLNSNAPIKYRARALYSPL